MTQAPKTALTAAPHTPPNAAIHCDPSMTVSRDWTTIEEDFRIRNPKRREKHRQ
jgi:hypothetical protein